VTATALVLSLLLMSGCASPEIPPWFDAIKRHPMRVATVNGDRIAYLDIGEGPPVILIHGFGGSMWQWEYQDALADRLRLIVVDMPGSGYSDKPDIAYTPDEVLARFVAFMDAIGLAKASLVGNSLGGGVAEGMAIRHPERVDRLVLISGLPDHVRDRLKSRTIRRALDTHLPVWIVTIGNWFAGRSVTRKVLQEVVYDHSLLTPAVLDRSYQNRKQRGVIAPLLAMGRNLPLWEEDLATKIGTIRHPTLILWGDKDEIFPPDVGHALHAQITGSRLEIVPNAGHIPQWERPDIVNPLLRAFLSP